MSASQTAQELRETETLYVQVRRDTRLLGITRPHPKSLTRIPRRPTCRICKRC